MSGFGVRGFLLARGDGRCVSERCAADHSSCAFEVLLVYGIVVLRVDVAGFYTTCILLLLNM